MASLNAGVPTREEAQSGAKDDPRVMAASGMDLQEEGSGNEEAAREKALSSLRNRANQEEEDLTWAAVFGGAGGPVQSQSARLTEGGSTGGMMLAEAVEIRELMYQNKLACYKVRSSNGKLLRRVVQVFRAAGRHLVQ